MHTAHAGPVQSAVHFCLIAADSLRVFACVFCGQYNASSRTVLAFFIDPAGFP
ncbi:MAG: hypothetical protein AB7P76_04900 [Candidatus Melainabacteria bacterium]